MGKHTCLLVRSGRLYFQRHIQPTNNYKHHIIEKQDVKVKVMDNFQRYDVALKIVSVWQGMPRLINFKQQIKNLQHVSC